MYSPTTMRNVLLCLSVLAAACSGETPTSPTTSSPTTDRAATNEARAATELPLQGSFVGQEFQQFQPPSTLFARVAARGNATHLGLFTLALDATVDLLTATAVGTITLTAANGDQIFATHTGRVVGQVEGGLNIEETATITGGTGRFAGATGSYTAPRFHDSATLATDGSIQGTISLNR
jgi:hypothetical protein